MRTFVELQMKRYIQISFSARLMSATSALSSSVIIIWAGFDVDVVVAIIVRIKGL